MCRASGEARKHTRIEPPMVFSRDGADHFVATLDRVLAEPW
jgi:4-aminobutyrate aminotransferase-like enzyme